MHYKYLFPKKACAGSCSWCCVYCRASNKGYAKVHEKFTMTEKAPTRALVGAFSVIVKSSRTFG